MPRYYFDIREGPPTIVTGVAIAADSTLLPRRRLRTFRFLRRGQPLDLNKLDSMRVAIAQVEQSADVTFGYEGQSMVFKMNKAAADSTKR